MRSPRMVVGAVGLLLLIGGFAWAVTGLHPFGKENSHYGYYTAHHAVPQRQTANSVVAVAFDYRAFDTLGEEFILFISVVGVVALLRPARGEQEEGAEEEVDSEQRHTSEATRWLGAALIGPITILAAYVITHGQLSPGGGFPGGVILMAALVLVFLGGEWLILVHVRKSEKWIELLESSGAAGFAMIGFGGLIAAAAFFQNFLPYGSSGNLLSGGMIPLANVAVGLEVAGAMLMVLYELVHQRLLAGRR